MTNTLMEYKGYHGKVEFNKDDQIFVGQVLGINDALYFHGESVKELTNSFEGCIENYLEYCKKAGKEPEREFKGSFNVRIKPEQHKRVAMYAASLGITINQFVSKAIEDELNTIEG